MTDIVERIDHVVTNTATISTEDWVTALYGARDEITRQREEIEKLRETLRVLGDSDKRFDKTGSVNSWSEVLARMDFARSVLPDTTRGKQMTAGPWSSRETIKLSTDMKPDCARCGHPWGYHTVLLERCQLSQKGRVSALSHPLASHHPTRTYVAKASKHFRGRTRNE